jgi:hypothetical protein
MFQTVSIPFWFNKGWRRLVAREIWWSLRNAGTGEISQPIQAFDSFIARGPASKRTVTGKREIMDECLYCRPRRSDSRLVTFVLLLLGCGLFVSACANDSDDDSGDSHRRHRSGNGRNREHMETIDHSSNPSPTPALGW